MRYAIIYRDETGAWIAEVPSLPGCISQGDTREEVVANIKEAIMLYLEGMDEDRKELYQEYLDPELIAIALIAE